MSQVDTLFQQAGFAKVERQAPAPGAAPATPPAEPPAPAAGGAPPAPAGSPPPAGGPGADAQNKNNPPANAAPGSDTPPAPAFDLKGILNGKFEKVEDLTKYVDELEQKANTSPFVNDYVKGLNDAISNGINPDVYARVANLDSEKLSDREALILKYQWKDKLTEEEATMLVDNEFRLGEDENADSDDVKLARIRAKTVANDAREFLKQHKVDQLTPPFEKKLEKQKQAWAPLFKAAVEPFKTIPLAGKAGSIDFPVPDEVLQKAQSALADVINNGRIMVMPDEEGMKLAKNVVFNHVLANSIPQIVDHIFDHFKTQHAMDLHNPGGAPGARGSNPPAEDGKMKMYKWLGEQVGVKI